MATGTLGDDTLYGTAASDSLFGLFGDDVLKGFGGADHLNGGAGIDTAMYTDSTSGVSVNLETGLGHGGSAAGDTLVGIENLYGSSYNDFLVGDAAANTFYGLSGLDILNGGAGFDTLDGGSGNDTLKGGGGADVLIGGAGIDTVDYSESSLGTAFIAVEVSLLRNYAAFADAEGDTFSGIENITGSSHRDLLQGDHGANLLRGLGHNDSLRGEGDDDRLEGGAGDDFLHGGDGDDILDGGSGADRMIGLTDNDIYFVDNAGDSITELGGQGVDEVRTSVSWTITAGADVETLRTTDDNGTAAINLAGNASGNTVRGNNGANLINGADGNDTLTGLGGADLFLFNNLLDAATNVDAITDFNVADDTIQIDNGIFAGLAAGTLAASQFVVGAAAQDADDRILYDNTSGALFFDIDGVGGAAAVRFATVGVGLALTSNDFLVV